MTSAGKFSDRHSIPVPGDGQDEPLDDSTTARNITDADSENWGDIIQTILLDDNFLDGKLVSSGLASSRPGAGSDATKLYVTTDAGDGDDVYLSYNDDNNWNPLNYVPDRLYVDKSEDAASSQVGRFANARSAPADNDEAYLTLELDDDSNTATEVARVAWQITDVTDTTEDGELYIQTLSAGSLATALTLHDDQSVEVPNGVLTLGDTSADPTANGELTLNGSDVKVYSGGSVRNLSNVGSFSPSLSGDYGSPVSVGANLQLDGNVITQVGGTSDAASGAIRLDHSGEIRARNNAGDGDVGLIATNSDDNVVLAFASATQVHMGGDVELNANSILGVATTDGTSPGINVPIDTGAGEDWAHVVEASDAGGSMADIRWGVDANLNLAFQVRDNDAGVNLFTVLDSGAVEVSSSGNPSESGTIRLDNDDWVAARNAGNSGDVNLWKVNASNEIEAGTVVKLGGDLNDAAGNTLYSDSKNEAESERLPEPYSYSTGMTQWADGLSNEEVDRFALQSGESLIVERIEFRQKGGGSSTSASVRVRDTGAGATIGSQDLGGTTKDPGSASSGPVTVQVTNSTGGSIDASIRVTGYIEGG